MNVKKFYQNHLQKKLFNKILAIYSSIIIITLIASSITVYKYYEQTITRQHVDANREVLDYVSLYMNQQYESIQVAIQQIYSDASVSEDLSYFLQHDYEDYLKYRLDQYADIGSSVPHTFDTYFKTYLNQKNGIYDVILYSTEKEFYYLYKNNTRQFYLSDMDGSKQKLSLPKNGWVSHETKLVLKEIREDNNNLYTMTREIKDPITLKTIGMLIVDFDAELISKWLGTKVAENNGQLLVLTPSGDVIYDSLGRYMGQRYPHIDALHADGWTTLDGISKVNLNTTNSSGLIMAGIIQKSQVNNEMKTVRTWIIGITTALIITAMSFTYGIILRFSKKVKIIIKSMKRLQEGDLSTRIHLNREDELQLIANNFNYMCERLELYINKVYISELTQKNAELVALQSQINPHFLYNTLEAIRMRAITQGAKDVGQMIYILSTLFRTMIKKSMVVTISDEIEYCNLYLELFQIRHKDRLQIISQISPVAMNCSIVKLLIQPVIENYIVHGFRPDRFGNLIRIEVTESGGEIQIAISDNGNGITPSKLTELQQMLQVSMRMDEPPSSVGLCNVNERIKLYYGTEYGLTIASEVNKGTIVIMNIPVVRESTNNAQYTYRG
ncbi:MULTISPECIES: cache domain-containing sensor histidine kinase [Paenibacillus]|uniref:cache domain-containing sensor histidine kinase n=1 Tax=Paenibacillus TaxID=44249 RepID=UPI0015C390DA|nr:sensor histidine kinase [Paenibacillus odorifer]